MEDKDGGRQIWENLFDRSAGDDGIKTCREIVSNFYLFYFFVLVFEKGGRCGRICSS